MYLSFLLFYSLYSFYSHSLNHLSLHFTVFSSGSYGFWLHGLGNEFKKQTMSLGGMVELHVCRCTGGGYCYPNDDRPCQRGVRYPISTVTPTPEEEKAFKNKSISSLFRTRVPVDNYNESVVYISAAGIVFQPYN